LHIIFYYNNEQKKLAEKTKKEWEKKLGKKIATEIKKAKAFYPAEEYHQKFTERTSQGMCHVPYQPI